MGATSSGLADRLITDGAGFRFPGFGDCDSSGVAEAPADPLDFFSPFRSWRVSPGSSSWVEPDVREGK
jgi:hypothetical protein